MKFIRTDIRIQVIADGVCFIKIANNKYDRL